MEENQLPQSGWGNHPCVADGRRQTLGSWGSHFGIEKVADKSDSQVIIEHWVGCGFLTFVFTALLRDQISYAFGTCGLT